MPRPISGPWGDLGPVGHICPEGSLEASRQPDGQHNNRSGICLAWEPSMT